MNIHNIACRKSVQVILLFVSLYFHFNKFLFEYSQSENKYTRLSIKPVKLLYVWFLRAIVFYLRTGDKATCIATDLVILSQPGMFCLRSAYLRSNPEKKFKEDNE